ncbi:MAG: GreA/GreB family elongation factor [Bacteroidales bacterium]|nr:GreA/GreB family elongation factor [Bacteroidales bacterium]
MSRGFIKEGDQEEIPMVPPRAYLPKGMPNYVTHEGLEALNKERESLENERVAVSGNYIMSNFIDAKMKLLIDRINTAVEVDMTKANKDTVSFGAYVKYNGRTVRIVGVDEADFSKGLLSFISPVAKALVGKKVGDKFEIKIPKGTEVIEVQGIWYEAVTLTVQESSHSDEIPRSARNDKGDGVKTSNSNEIPRLHAVARNDSSVSVISTEAERSGEISNKIDIFEPEENIMEFLPVVNERGIIVGRALHMELHKGNKILHPVIHLHVINNKGIVSYRYWWHVAFGDTPEKTLKRKLSETLGITGVKPKLKKQYIRETKTEKELVYVYILNSEENLLKTPEGKDYFDIFAKD